MQLSDRLPYGFVADDQTFSDLMDNFNGLFCYRYEGEVQELIGRD